VNELIGSVQYVSPKPVVAFASASAMMGTAMRAEHALMGGVGVDARGLQKRAAPTPTWTVALLMRVTTAARHASLGTGGDDRCIG